MFDSPAVFVDIETNGGNGDRGRITEIALIRVEDGNVVEEFTSLVNPGSPIPYWITRLTGITDADVADAPYFDEIAESLKRLFSGAITTFQLYRIQEPSVIYFSLVKPVA